MKKKNIIIILLIVIAFVAYILLGNHFHFYLFCPIHKFLGLYCPGCGVTRMFLALFHGDIYQAYRYNPGLFITIPFFLIYGVDKIRCYLNGKYSYFETKMPKIIWYILLIYFVIYTILRNIPAFNYLIPTVI